VAPAIPKENDARQHRPHRRSGCRGYRCRIDPAQQPAADPPKPTAEADRYQLVTDRDGRPGYLFDTATGRVWQPFFSEKVGERAEHIKPPKAK
jgi:hypothetical protein